MNNKIPVLFATDSGYVMHLATAIHSLLENNPSLFSRVIIFTSEIPGRDRKKLLTVCEKFKMHLEFVLLNDEWFDGLVLNHHFKKSNYYRLFAADLIDEDKCLYLDADIVVNGSIDEIIYKNIDENYLAAVVDPVFNLHNELGIKADSGYFNSGVMLINLAKWRSSSIKNRVISFVKKRPEVIHFVDQCGLNAVVDGNWVELDATYNLQSCMLNFPGYESCKSIKIPNIIHYTGASKPWHMNNKHPYKMLYWYYRSQTPYKSFFPDDLSFLNMVRYVVPGFIRSFFKEITGIKK